MATVTPMIEIAVDEADRLVAYSIDGKACERKPACGFSLLEHLQGKTAAEISTLKPLDLTDDSREPTPQHAALVAQHLRAIQSALRVLVGCDDCGPEAACAAAVISHDGEVVTLRAVLNAEMNEISASGCCATRGASSCGKRAVGKEPCGNMPSQ